MGYDAITTQPREGLGKGGRKWQHCSTDQFYVRRNKHTKLVHKNKYTYELGALAPNDPGAGELFAVGVGEYEGLSLHHTKYYECYLLQHLKIKDDPTTEDCS